MDHLILYNLVSTRPFITLEVEYLLMKVSILGKVINHDLTCDLNYISFNRLIRVNLRLWCSIIVHLGGPKHTNKMTLNSPPLLLEFFAVNLSRKNNKIVSFYLSTVEMNLLFVVSCWLLLGRQSKRWEEGSFLLQVLTS